MNCESDIRSLKNSSSIEDVKDVLLEVLKELKDLDMRLEMLENPEEEE